MLRAAAIAAAAWAAGAVLATRAFRRWDLERGAEVERIGVYAWTSVAWPATWPVGWRWYGRRGRR